MTTRIKDHNATDLEGSGMPNGLSPWDGISWVATAAVATIAWLGRRHVARIDTTEKRLGELEKEIASLATKNDLETIRTHVDDRIELLRRDMAQQHAQIVSYLMRGTGER